MEKEFIIGKQLGEGTYGQVFDAEAKSAENFQMKKYAIKRHKNLEESEGFSAYALREISILKSLHHENVLRVLKVFVGSEDSGSLLFEKQQCDLSYCLKHVYNRSMPLYQVRSFIRQLFKALEYCHSHSVMHRDVKPANILVDRRGRLQLSDFGCARCWKPGRNYTLECGTAWYRAPEIFLKKEDYTMSVDIWSAGCVWWELLTGSPAFVFKKDENPMDLIVLILGFPHLEFHKGLADIPDIHESLETLPFVPFPKHPTFSRKPRGTEWKMFRSCLDQDPYRRVSARQVLWELDHIKADLHSLPEKYFKKMRNTLT